MTRQEIKDWLVAEVNESTGIKAIHLAAKLGTTAATCSGHVGPEIFDEIVQEGLIEKLEYVLPSMDYRIKTMYFPKGTKIVGTKVKL